MIENVGVELKKYFQNVPVLSSLLGLDLIILFGGVLFLALGIFVSLGGFIAAVFTYVFYLGLLLTLANLNFNYLYMGLGCYTAISLIEWIVNLAGDYNIFSWGHFIAFLLFGFLTYVTYMKSVKK